MQSNLPQRRSMADALQPTLKPEAIAIIKAGTPQPQTPGIALAPVTTDKLPEKSIISEKLSAPVPSVSKPRKEIVPETRALVSFNMRFPADLPPALLKASVDRKLNKIKPYTQQDIVAEALRNWLAKNGYLS